MRLIDADAVFPWYVEAFKGKIEPHEVRFSMNDIQGNLWNIPTADQWTPITDKLPDLDKCVLATTSWGTITIAERWKDTKGEEKWFVSEGECNAERDDIVAWMPLPEPYKGD